MSSTKIYFKNLNGLRFIAAFFVIIHHLEQFKSIFGIPTVIGESDFVAVIGKLGVVLFFVLSGFLITYLLLLEEKNYKKINIKQFYMRRLLRIWPLYFFIIIISLFVLPFIDAFNIPGYTNEIIFANITIKLVLFTFFFPNLVLSMYGVIPFASQTWSIGTEEQFYLIWPNMIKHIKHYRFLLMISIVIIYMVIREVLKYYSGSSNDFYAVAYEFWKYFNIDCMAIGAFFAIMLHTKHWLLKFLLNNISFYTILILTIFLLSKGLHFPYIHFELYASLFAVIILNFSSNPDIKISLENKLFNFLGKISYGLYMYHAIAIVLTIYIGRSFDLLSNWFLYPVSIILTIVIATISYNYFESFFLGYKKRFSRIISGNDIKS